MHTQAIDLSITYKRDNYHENERDPTASAIESQRTRNVFKAGRLVRVTALNPENEFQAVTPSTYKSVFPINFKLIKRTAFTYIYEKSLEGFQFAVHEQDKKKGNERSNRQWNLLNLKPTQFRKKIKSGRDCRPEGMLTLAVPL
jgi:hypothetical protein